MLLDPEDEHYRSRACFVTQGRVTKYVYCQIYQNSKYYRLHRLLVNAPPDKVVDHINGDTLDNRKSNLRICEISENVRSQHAVRENKSSVFKGVFWNKKKNAWEAQIQFNKKRIYIGRFKDESQAAEAYDSKAKDFFGIYAKTNF